MPWQLLGSFAPDELPHTREQLHCVIQVVASVPRLLVPNPKDGSYTHSAFTWDRQRHAIVSAEVPSDVRFHVGIRPADATVFLLDTSGNEIATQSADGMAIETLFRWLTRQIVDLTASALPRPLTDAERGLPVPCVAGQEFDLGNRPALAELSRYYDNASLVLEAIRAQQPHAAPLYVWPHHMDIAFTMSIDPNERGARARSVNLGMEPGDGYYPEPYFYSSPAPAPNPDAFPGLALGAWHIEGFTGAVLPAAEIVAAGDASAQQQAVETFARSAIQANRTLLKA